ncbi:MAG: GntR family transcriptional regulator [Sinorhizobium meliloti]|nr:GntR family transcriptional regulator [Sinorhizobium meliloti]
MWSCDKAPQCRGPGVLKVGIASRRRGKADEAYDAVLKSLYSNARPPGQHLSDQELASELHLGRTPVREALIRLAAEGKIASLPKKGYFTRPLLEWALLDSYVVAREILTFAVAYKPAQAVRRTAFCGLPSANLALRAEAVFAEIVRRSSNCEACQIIDKFCFCSHPVRLEIAASELSPSFKGSLARLTDALTLGTREVKAALMKHLDLEQGAVPRAVQEIGMRRSADFPFIARMS